MRMIARMTPEEIQSRVAAVPFWWHTIDLGHGVMTPGQDRSAEKLARLALPDDLRGKTVLDIGAWDGFFSFEAERRGAQRVVAMDLWDPARGGEHPVGFETARAVLESRVESVRMGVEELSPERIGRFDIVLFLGVLYHIHNPLGALQRIRSVTRELLVLETEVDMLFTRRPCLAFYPGRELREDPTNWFAPNRAALSGILHAAGFGSARTVWESSAAHRLSRALRHGRGRPSQVWAWLQRGRVVVHAQP